jgi:N-acetylneuraminic acid mutarotase
VKESAYVLILLMILCFTIPALPLVTAAEEGYWTTLEPMPTARGFLRVGVVDGKMYAISSSYNGANEEYDPVLDEWKTKANMPNPNPEVAIAVCQAKVYCMGGMPIGFIGASDANKVYDPKIDSWETKAAMPTPRYDMQAQGVGEKIYVIGGRTLLGYEQGSKELDVNEVYDPASDTWTTAAPLPIIGCYVSAVVDGKIFVIGNTTQIYDPQTDTWSTAAPPLTELVLDINGDFAKAAATSGTFAPKRIYVYAGATVQIYDPQTNSWTYGSPPPTIRHGLGIGVVDDRLYFIGGFTGLSPFEVYTEYATNEKYTPSDYIPEFPSWTLLLTTMVAGVAAVFFFRDVLKKKRRFDGF